jgi:hypothetical protein
MAQDEGPEFKPQYYKKTKQNKSLPFISFKALGLRT